MRRMVAVLVGVLAAAVAAQGALASGDGKVTLGPAGYSGPGAKGTLMIAGTAGVVLGSDDHVVICHATGGKKGDGFVQIAPSASGVVKGHDKHQDDRDVIPPFTYAGKYGNDASLAAGQNWNAANAAAYANGCRATAATPPPADVCPNIEGIQSSIPSGMTKDSAGNCVTVVTLTPTTTVVVEKVVVNTMVVKKVVVQKAKTKKAKKAKKINVKAKTKKKAKAKIRVKGVSKKFTPRVLPHTR